MTARLSGTDARGSEGEEPGTGSPRSVPMGASPAERLVLRVLARLHREQPLVAGFRIDAVVARVLAEADAPRPPRSHRGGRRVALDAATIHEALAVLADRGLVERTGRRVTLGGGAGPELDPETRRRADEVLAALLAAGMRPPPLRTLARDAGLSERALDFLRARGEIVGVAPDVDFPAETVAVAERVFRELVAQEGGVRAARFRDALGTGRRHAVALLEYFDTTGVAERDGELHRLTVDHAADGRRRLIGPGDPSGEHDTRGVS